MVTVIGTGWLCGCVPGVPLPPDTGNTSDPTNGGATYVGSAACSACHSEYAATQSLHGHANVLKATFGVAPSYPSGPGVPEPPPGLAWTDVDLVVGGAYKAAAFIDRDGFLVSDPGTGDVVKYHLPFPANGTAAGFSATPVSYAQLPYDFSCFRCHTTGPLDLADSGGRRQGNRPGIGGTWAENGVQCESCHGPGSRHVPNPSAGNIFLDGISASCSRCHAGFDNSGGLASADGFIIGNQQVGEVNASPHRGFSCSVCHDPHASVWADTRGVRNQCQTCHSNMNMALHEGKVFVQGDYTEPLGCESCHMPLASRYVTAADPAFTGGVGRVGDTRTHIMSIATINATYTAFFTEDGAAVRTDADGHAAVTLDFVCLRCHTGRGNAFVLTLPAAAGVAGELHRLP